ncbi:MAG: helix-turn-helix domain-containing protein [Lachnospiraceae bacterium]|nr:helix-turn-helix domain-containing protein [Candidatus Equihabitans merdae]
MLSDNLIMLRNIKGLSQEDVAEVAGVSRQAYAKWEKGDTLPDVEKCAIMAEYYGVTIDSLWKTNEPVNGIPVSPAPKGKHIFGTVTVSERGQIVIPKEARDLFNLTGGTRLIVLGDEGEGLALLPAESFERTLRETLARATKIREE